MKKVFQFILILTVINFIPLHLSVSAFGRPLVSSNTRIVPAIQNEVSGAYIYSELHNQTICLYLPVDSSILSCERFSIYFGLKDFISTFESDNSVYIDLRFVDKNGNEYAFHPETESDRFYNCGKNKLIFKNSGNYPIDYCGLVSFSPESFFSDKGVSAKDVYIDYLQISVETIRGEEQKLFIGNVYYQNNNKLFEAYNIYNTAKTNINKYTTTAVTTAAKNNKSTNVATTKAAGTKTASVKTTASASTKATEATATKTADNTELSQGGNTIDPDRVFNTGKSNSKMSAVIIMSSVAAVIAVLFAVAFITSNDSKNQSEAKSQQKKEDDGNDK